MHNLTLIIKEIKGKLILVKLKDYAKDSLVWLFLLLLLQNPKKVHFINLVRCID